MTSAWEFLRFCVWPLLTGPLRGMLAAFTADLLRRIAARLDPAC